MQKTKPLIERFVSKLQLDPVTNCWNWTGCIQKDGYGNFGWVAKFKNVVTFRAHQAAWMIWRGPLPTKGTELDHRCKNRRCCNPDHLRITTDKEQCANRDPKAVCRHGHRYDEVGFIWCKTKDKDGKPYRYRVCKACRRAYEVKWNHVRRIAVKHKCPAAIKLLTPS